MRELVIEREDPSERTPVKNSVIVFACFLSKYNIVLYNRLFESLVVTNLVSPLLAIHLVDVLYSYCFTLRREWQSDSLGAATMVLSVSSVLGQKCTTWDYERKCCRFAWSKHALQLIKASVAVWNSDWIWSMMWFTSKGWSLVHYRKWNHQGVVWRRN